MGNIVALPRVDSKQGIHMLITHTQPEALLPFPTMVSREIVSGIFVVTIAKVEMYLHVICYLRGHCYAVAHSGLKASTYFSHILQTEQMGGGGAYNNDMYDEGWG
mmetsp:Transcript_15104/g.44508  ORF Transcript_15104/g.44508 Transcript_15104/m.44508 type:complete len:105 (-) Transcript_15104:165-479(-)|eukprot:353608-Chlamydomonas_euryale.AAC.6